MRKRAKRDLLTLIGIALILGGIVGVNMYMRIQGLRELAIAARKAMEQEYQEQGTNLIDWDLLRQVKGSLRGGAEFPELLTKMDEQPVNIVGFMAPIKQFRKASDFMLLPMPITCYFCDSPPPRDIIRIQVRTHANMVNEPVIIGGLLELQGKKGDPFFYTIKESLWNKAVDMAAYTDKHTPLKHQEEALEGWRNILNGDQPAPPLQQGYTPPSTSGEE